MDTAALDYQQRKVQSLCTRAGCSAPASEESSLCEPHHRAAKERAKAGMRKLRRRRKREHCCVHCGGPRKPRTRSCLACRVRRNRVHPQRSGVTDDVNKTERVASQTRTHEDGRTRYHGQGKRGQQPKTQLNLQDGRLARDRFDAFHAGVMLLASDEAKTWTQGQRESVEKATASCGESASRHIDDVLERLGHFKVRHGRRDGE
jgi:hypothetical protein